MDDNLKSSWNPYPANLPGFHQLGIRLLYPCCRSDNRSRSDTAPSQFLQQADFLGSPIPDSNHYVVWCHDYFGPAIPTMAEEESCIFEWALFSSTADRLTCPSSPLVHPVKRASPARVPLGNRVFSVPLRRMGVFFFGSATFYPSYSYFLLMPI